MKAKIGYIPRMTSNLNDQSSNLIYKKIPSIPPLLVNNNFISDIRVKASLFNDFLAPLYTTINNGSTLSQFAYKIDVKINSFRVNQNDILLITKTSDAEKAHGWDNISIKMVQDCNDSIALPLICRHMEKSKCVSCS